MKQIERLGAPLLSLCVSLKGRHCMMDEYTVTTYASSDDDELARIANVLWNFNRRRRRRELKRRIGDRMTSR